MFRGRKKKPSAIVSSSGLPGCWTCISTRHAERSAKLRPHRPDHQGPACPRLNRRDLVQHVRGERDQSTAFARRSVDQVAGANLQVAALVIAAIAELQA